MTAPAGSSLYTDAVLEARARGYRIGRVALESLVQAFRDAAQRIEFDLLASDNPLTVERGQALRAQIDGILRDLERTTGQTTNAAVRLTVEDVVRIHERVVAELFQRYTGQTDAAVVQGLNRVNARAVAVLAARNEVSGGAAGFQTLMRLHLEDAGPDLDRLISSAIARGVSTRELTRDIAAFLADGVANLGPYDLSPTELSGLGTLLSDARRIAVTSTLDALREAQAQSMMESQIIAAVQWALSGNHPLADECDLLASVDWYGYGPGFYPPEKLPVAPHPHCACGPRETRLRHPSEWNTPRPAGPALAIDWQTFDPTEHISVAWSDLRTQRAITALRRSVLDPIGRRARRAA